MRRWELHIGGRLARGLATAGLVIVLVVGSGALLSPVAARSGITADTRSYNFGKVSTADYINGPVVFVSSTVSGVQMSATDPAPNPPFVTSTDGCNGLTSYPSQPICQVKVDFNNTTPVAPGHYVGVYTLRDQNGKVLVKIRYRATVAY